MSKRLFPGVQHRPKLARAKGGAAYRWRPEKRSGSKPPYTLSAWMHFRSGGSRRRFQIISEATPHTPFAITSPSSIPDPPGIRNCSRRVGRSGSSLALQSFFLHRAAAAFRAISARSAFVRAFARAFPPALPPCRANSSRSSTVRPSIEALPPFLPSATACGSFRFGIDEIIAHYLAAHEKAGRSLQFILDTAV